MKKNVLLMAVLIAFCLTSQAQGIQQRDDDSKYATELVKVGEQAPDFKMKTAEGKTVKLSKLAKGRWTLLDFWASWCPDCRKDMPSVKRMYADFAPKGVQFVGVSFDTDAEVWKKAIAQYDLKYTQVSELKKMRESVVAQAYGVKWIPSMVLLNPEGKVVMSTVLADKMERTLYQTFAPKERPVIGTTEELSIDGSLGKLAAVIQKPSLAQGQQCPMVMLCHGFGGSKEGLMFDLIADSLCAHGIASIRFDFNGHGKSEGEFVNMTVPNEIEDAKKVYEYVRDLRYVSKVGILGHSQGGVVASMTAGDFPEDFAAVVLMAIWSWRLPLCSVTMLSVVVRWARPTILMMIWNMWTFGVRNWGATTSRQLSVCQSMRQPRTTMVRLSLSMVLPIVSYLIPMDCVTIRCGREVNMRNWRSLTMVSRRMSGVHPDWRAISLSRL